MRNTNESGIQIQPLCPLFLGAGIASITGACGTSDVYALVENPSGTAWAGGAGAASATGAGSGAAAVRSEWRKGNSWDGQSGSAPLSYTMKPALLALVA